MTADERVRAECPDCGARMRVSAHVAGKRVRCPKCKGAFTVPHGEEPVDVVVADDLFGDGLLAELGSGTTVERTDEYHASQSADGARGGRSPQNAPAPSGDEAGRANRPSLVAWLSAFGDALFEGSMAVRIRLLAMCGGAVLIVLGAFELDLHGRTSEEPQTITCERLSTWGPGENYHVVMTDFVLLPAYVYETRLTGWTGAWVPAVSYADLDEQVRGT